MITLDANQVLILWATYLVKGKYVYSSFVGHDYMEYIYDSLGQHMNCIICGIGKHDSSFSNLDRSVS